MTERTHFRCHAYGLLSVAVCRANRKLRLSASEGAVVGAMTGRVRPLACRDCAQAPRVDAGTEPSLTTLAELQRHIGSVAPPPKRPAPAVADASRRPKRSAPAPAALLPQPALPPDSPMAGVSIVAEPFPPRPAKARPVRRTRKTKATAAPAARGFPPGNGAGPVPPAPSLPRAVARLLRDAASGTAGLPSLQRRALRILRALGREVPPEPPLDIPLPEYEARTRWLDVWARRGGALLAVAAIALGLAAGPARAADAAVLHAICAYETRGERHPAWAVAPNGADWGLCQVKYHSAVAFGGYPRGRNPGDLFDPVINRAVARAILADCRARYPNATVYRLAYCYKEGPYAVPARDRKRRPARYARGHAYARAIEARAADPIAQR